MTMKIDWLTEAFEDAKRQWAELPDWAKPVKVVRVGDENES
jgi:hypothetical protein